MENRIKENPLVGWLLAGSMLMLLVFAVGFGEEIEAFFTWLLKKVL
jgi:hypothetical protein